MQRKDTTDTFVCFECRGEIPVDTQTKQALIRCGCAVCGAAVTEGAFASCH